MDDNTEVAGASTKPESDYNDAALSNSEYLTQQELMKRRANRLRRLANCYRDHYWLLMEDVRRKHREFIWKFGKDSCDAPNGVAFGDNINNHTHTHNNSNAVRVDNGGDDGDNYGGNFNRCRFANCRSKSMAMTRFCHSHILSDSKQMLYVKCQFAHKCGKEPILCGKPILRSTTPAMCTNHLKSTKQNIQRAMKRNGASGAASTRLSSKFHVVLSEYVRLIQNRRRARRERSLAVEDNTTT